MIFNGKKMVSRTLVLSALTAARRAGEAGPGTSGARRWVPVGLRWKKRPSPPNIVRNVNHFASLTKVTSFSQFNFYLDRFLINRGIVSAGRGSGRPVAHGGQRASVNTPAQMVRAKRRELRGRPGEPMPRRPDAGAAGLEKTVKEDLAVKRGSISKETRETLHTFLTRQKDLFRGVIPKRAGSTGETAAAGPSGRGHFRAMPERVFAGSRRASAQLGGPAVEARVKRGAGTANIPRAGFENVFGRSDELVWRRVKTSTEIEEEISRSRRDVDQPAETIRPGVPPAAGRGYPAHAVERAVSGTVMNFDPAMIDRLTNEIIRKVEKRARVERERRGIN